MLFFTLYATSILKKQPRPLMHNESLAFMFVEPVSHLASFSWHSAKFSSPVLQKQRGEHVVL